LTYGPIVHRRRIPVLLLAVLVVTGCAGHDPSSPRAEAPVVAGLVTTRDPTVAIPDKDGHLELCISGTADSLPARCLEPAVRLHGWPSDAKRDIADFEYLVTGRLDGATLRVKSIHRWDDDRDTRAPDWGDGQNDYATLCPAPSGGWRVRDAALTTDAQIDNLEFAAAKLPGYTAFWWDFSRTPSGGRDNDPNHATANLMVDHDVAGARAALRKRWGGALCVTRSRHSSAEQQRIFDDLAQLPGLIATSGKWDSIDCLVIADDGTLQRWVDRRFGRGYVRITPALQSVTD
jgi:hypothetical protein